MDVSIPCPCPNTPHESDTVTMVDVLDFHRAQSILSLTALLPTDDMRSRAAEVIAAINEGYLLFGVERWTLRDPKPVEVTKSNIRRYVLERPEVYPTILAAVDEHYSKAVAIPLGLAESISSPATPTDTPTSPKRTGGRTARRRSSSKQSSISTIPTDATETTSMSPEYDSSLSPSSESAA